MKKTVKPEMWSWDKVHTILGRYPHCDSKVLHAPGECQYCDQHPDWQALRITWGIAFSGYEPEEKELPCPADFARPGKSQLWNGNIPVPTGTGGAGIF